MSEKDRAELGASLKGYKENVPPVTKASLEWQRELIFTGLTERRYEVDFDAHLQWGCKPTDTLLLSLAGCLAIDVVSFLQKMKGELASFKIDVIGERNPTPPQFFKAIDLVLHIAGKNLDSKKIDRAIALSHEKYCSVYHSLRPDMDIRVKYTLEEKDPSKEAGG